MPTDNQRWQWVPMVAAAIMGITIVAGATAGYLIGREPPQWMVQAIGAIIMGAFAHGAFFVQARAQAAPAAALAATLSRYHELAMTGAQSGHTIPEPAGEAPHTAVVTPITTSPTP